MSHLVLSRKEGERIQIETSDGPIFVDPLKIRRGKVRLGIDAPPKVIIWREEVAEQRVANGQATRPSRLAPRPSSLVYLACPYSHPHPGVRELRFELASQVAAAMLARGVPVFSPISHSHPIEHHLPPADWATWAPIDAAILRTCRVMKVLCLDGWKESVGVQAEIGICAELDIPVERIYPDDNVLVDQALLARYQKVLEAAAFPTASTAS